MRRPHTLVVALTVGAGAALMTGVAGGASTAGRQPPPAIELQGFFHRAAWEGDVRLTISETGKQIAQVDGILPGICEDARSGRLAKVGRDGAIGVLFVARPNAPIRPNGTFAFTARVSADSGFPPHTITMQGTFYGSNVLGSVRGKSGKDSRYSSCRGDRPFYAKRVR